MDRKEPSLGILLASAASIDLALERATPDAQWFLMDDAVRELPSLRQQIDAGADVTVCAADAAAFGVEPIAGVRFGSQYDHAVMIRSVERVLALTGARIDDHRPRRSERTVIVRVTRETRLEQALRSAVGYAGGDLRVALLLEPAVQRAVEQPTASVARAIAALRGLDHPIVDVVAGEYPARLRWDVEVTW